VGQGDRGFRTGQVFAGRYRLDEVAGEGPLGVSYKARDVLAGSECVLIKLLHARMQQLTPELRELRNLVSPRLVRRLDVGILDGRAFIVSEYLEGRSLAALLQDEPVASDVVLQLMAALAEGLSVLHRHGLLHGALTPHNVFITGEGELKLADYGLPVLPSEDTPPRHAA